MQMNAPGAAQGKHTGETNQLYMAFELGEKNWKLALSDGARSPSHYTVTAGDTTAVFECIATDAATGRIGLDRDLLRRGARGRLGLGRGSTPPSCRRDRARGGSTGER